MTNEIIIAIISAAVGGIITWLTMYIVERHKDKRADRSEEKEIFKARPEIEIVDYKDYLVRTGYGIKQKCDIELFIASLESVTVEGEKDRTAVNAHYRSEDMDSKEWCCVIYTFKNAGKTDISTLDIICNYKKDTCIFPCAQVRPWMEGNLLNYNYCYDKKIRVGDTIIVKICYHNECILPGMFSAVLSIGMIDDNGRYWTQPLFAPQNKIYDSRPISAKKYREEISTYIAEECFKNPSLW